MNTNHSTDKRLWLFVLARVYLGASFFFSDHGSAKPGELTGFLQYGMQHGYSWYQKFLSATVIPHAATFGTLIVIAEIYVAIALVFGLTTRLAACVAIFFAPELFVRQGRAPLGARHRPVGYCPCDHYPLEQCGPSAWS